MDLLPAEPGGGVPPVPARVRPAGAAGAAEPRHAEHAVAEPQGRVLLRAGAAGVLRQQAQRRQEVRQRGRKVRQEKREEPLGQSS